MTAPVPDLAGLVHAYGVATDTPAHLAALVGGDVDAVDKAVYHLNSAIIHQSTPWPATGPAVRYVCERVLDGTLAPSARPGVTRFLAEVADAIAVATDQGPEDLEAQRDELAADHDLAAMTAELAELDEGEAEEEYEAWFEEAEIADLVVIVGYLDLLDLSDLVTAARQRLDGAS